MGHVTVVYSWFYRKLLMSGSCNKCTKAKIYVYSSGFNSRGMPMINNVIVYFRFHYRHNSPCNCQCCWSKKSICVFCCCVKHFTTTSWWRHQMETFSALLALCAGTHRSPVNSPHKGQWRGSLMGFFHLCLNKRLSKPSSGWWFETPSRSLWRHCNVTRVFPSIMELQNLSEDQAEGNDVEIQHSYPPGLHLFNKYPKNFNPN